MHIDDLYCFTVRNKTFAYDIRTTACAGIDNVALSVLPALIRASDQKAVAEQLASTYPEETLDAALNQCNSLFNSGVFGAIPPAYRHTPDRSLLGVALHVSHTCNLGCTYCYADKGTFGRQSQLMTDATIKQSIDFVFEHSGRQPSVNIGFFGGEPLLNFPVIQEAVTYAQEQARKRNQEVSFSLTSNGTLLTDEIMAFLADARFSLIFSLDGPANIHDKMRKDRRGHATHGQILENLIRLRDTFNTDFMVRGTFTRNTPNFADQVLFLNDMGFSSVSVEPAQLHPDDPLSITSQTDIECVKQEYDRLGDLYLQRLKDDKPLHFYHFDKPLRDILEPSPQHTQCGAGKGFIAITPEGDVFPCFEAVVEPENQIGHINSGFEKKNRERFARMHVGKRRGCTECWIRYHCGGGCHAFNIRYNDNLHKPYEPFCEFIKHRYMLSAWILSEAIEAGEDILNRLKTHVGLLKPVQD